jgi:hypothetical protein
MRCFAPRGISSARPKRLKNRSYSYLCTRQDDVPAEGPGLALRSRKDTYMGDSDNSQALAEIVALLRSIESYVKKISAEVAER